jgi:hypothetical protein
LQNGRDTARVDVSTVSTADATAISADADAADADAAAAAADSLRCVVTPREVQARID